MRPFLCWQMLAPLQSLHPLLWRLCWQMPVPPQSLHLLLMRLCSKMLLHAVLAPAPLAVMLADAGAPAVLAPVPAAVMLADPGTLAALALSPLAVMLALVAPPLRCAHPLPLPPPFLPATRPPCSHHQSHGRPAAPPRCRQPAPRGTRGTFPAASRARNLPHSPPPVPLDPPR
jgi:hypothetical protein